MTNVIIAFDRYPRFAKQIDVAAAHPSTFFLVPLAIDAIPMYAGPDDHEGDWGTERQIDAENKFFEQVYQHLSDEAQEELEDWCYKANTEEMLEKGLELATTAILSRGR